MSRRLQRSNPVKHIDTGVTLFIITLIFGLLLGALLCQAQMSSNLAYHLGA